MARPAQADDQRPTPNPLYDVVAVGRGPGKILLATPARPFSDYRWRFRAIPLRPEGAGAEQVELSRSATKALVVMTGGAERVFDLTDKVEGISAVQTPALLHHLPGQLFAVTRGEQVCLIDDAGQTAAPCRTARHAAVHEDGRVLYALQDDTLVTARAGSDATELLPYRLPSGARYELLAGHEGDQRDFLLLVGRGEEVQIIDPTRANGHLRSYDSWEVAALRAILDFNSAEPDPEHGRPSDETLRALAANLIQQAQSASYQWSFFRVRPEIALYAPLLEFAPEEPAYPSDVGIWDTLNPITKGKTREDYQAAYDSLGKERWARCKVYFRQASYPGSWLLEYWYYYPFDEGKPHRHIHDSEHVFIEVDKLGGAVRSYLASDHGQFAPNNSYSTLVPGARPVELPLFALVEFEKHAMSPDINHDGKFTLGVDVNLYRDRFTIWGLRDLGANKEHLMMRYKSWMSLPRKKEDHFTLTNSSSYFPGLEVDPGKATCGLLPFPDDPPCKNCEPGSTQSAEAHLTAHNDARKPEDIYKPWVLPWHQVRIGWGLFDHSGNQTQLYSAFVGELSYLTGGFIRLPGRVSFEAMWSPVTRTLSVTSNGQNISGHRSYDTYAGMRYERLLTGTQGFYFGVTPLFERQTTEAINGVAIAPDSRWIYQGVWYRAGYIFELPFQKKGNMTHHVGYVIHGKSFRFEWRVSLGVLRYRGRHWFGISENDPSPYQ